MRVKLPATNASLTLALSQWERVQRLQTGKMV